MSRPIIRWDADAQEWVVWQQATRIGAFSKLYEAERFVCGGGIEVYEPDSFIDLDERAEVDR